MPRFSLLVVALGLFVLSVASGCGSKPYASTVSGIATLDDKPLTSGTVTFHPPGDGAVAYGPIDASGNYKVSTGSTAGMSPGEYLVTVVSTGPAPAEEVPGPLLTPPKYGTKQTTDLKVTIKAGSNDIPLKLVTPK